MASEQCNEKTSAKSLHDPSLIEQGYEENLNGTQGLCSETDSAENSDLEDETVVLTCQTEIEFLRSQNHDMMLQRLLLRNKIAKLKEQSRPLQACLEPSKKRLDDLVLEQEKSQQRLDQLGAPNKE